MELHTLHSHVYYRLVPDCQLPQRVGAMPTHDPSRKKGSWRARKRRVKVSTPPCEEPTECVSTYEYAFVDGAENDSLVVREPSVPKMLGSLKEMARLVWEDDYTTLFKLEQMALESEHGLMSAAKLFKECCKKSAYQLRYQEDTCTKQDDARAMSFAAVAMRQANQQSHSFSVCVRSLAALTRRIPSKEWRHQCRHRTLLDRATTTKLLRMVMEASGTYTL